ncbi:MAG: RNA polymerase sigma-70 factor [Balneolaceae bacterium]|nr:RNA polymerase sigma-70 factor [Balneolaceae bacterium]
MNNPTDKQIGKWVEQISESNRESFDRLFRALYPQLVRFSMRYTGNRGAASDLAQDAFVVLWNKRSELKQIDSPKAYVYSMVRNRSLNYIRDHTSRTTGLEAMEEPSAEMTHDEEQEEWQLHLLKEWIGELPDRRREAFELSRFEGLDHDEIAEVMGISSNTVNNHIVAALDYLKDRHHAYREEANSKAKGYD